MTLGNTYISLVNLYNCFVFWDAAQQGWGEAKNKLAPLLRNIKGVLLFLSLGKIISSLSF